MDANSILFKAMGGAFILTAVLAFGVYLNSELNASAREISDEQIEVVAEELGINKKDVIIDVDSEKSYNTFHTSEGEYKVTFDYKEDQPIIKSIVKVDSEEGDEK